MLAWIPQSLSIQRTGEHSGNGGSSFEDLAHFVSHPVRITAVTVRTVRVIQAKHVTSACGVTRYHGGGGGSYHHFSLDYKEDIVPVTGRSGGLVDQLTLYTSKGRHHGPYGRSGGSPFSHYFGASVLVYVFGREGGRSNASASGTPRARTRKPPLCGGRAARWLMCSSLR